MRLVPYLYFPGNTREAMAYYQGVFGGELEITTFGDFGIEGVPADGVMHSSLKTDAFELFAAEAQAGADATWGGTRVSLMVVGDDVDQLGGWFNQIAADGEVVMPYEPQVWGDTYGLVRDRYGIEWMFDAGSAEGAS